MLQLCIVGAALSKDSTWTPSVIQVVGAIKHQHFVQLWMSHSVTSDLVTNGTLSRTGFVRHVNAALLVKDYKLLATMNMLASSHC